MTLISYNPTTAPNYEGETMSNLEYFLHNQYGINIMLRNQLLKAYVNGGNINIISSIDLNSISDDTVRNKLTELIANEDAPLR